ncbi:ribokinase [Paucibacter oligotrophus]|uniref:Ribokinase n=1 Tax=Roseateles oligotrophus TaxID=1769250 RepID=A0A840LAW0_9BURK|nr:PfkB family carbohydrate kinase [Roseateles oligotrophus]MBB4842497.1 ribokinase [Roseateles oligotrophus]
MRLFVAANFVMACCWRVQRLPREGETLLSSSFAAEPGGKGLNVAIGARRLGAEVDALLGIGRDAAGDRLLALLAEEGMAPDHAYRLADSSGHGCGLIDAHGRNSIAVCLGPNLLLEPRHADAAAEEIARADAVYGQFETSLGALQRVFEIAARHGRLTVLNPSPYQPIPAELLALTRVLLANEVEAAELLDWQLPQGASLSDCAASLDAAAQAFWPRWPQGQLLLLTLGALGAVALRRDRPPLAVPGFAVAVQDSMGAGDAFAAGLLTQLLSGQDLAASLRVANACGALMCMRAGVLQGLPRAADLQAFLLRAAA